MQVVKNFGFSRPFIKTMQAGDYIRFADEVSNTVVPNQRPNSRLPMDRIKGASRRPSSGLSLGAFTDWCQSMKESWEGCEEEAARAPGHWRAFEEARAFARSLKLTSGAEWRRFSKGEVAALGRRPEDIPGCPERIYRECGWKGYRDWLGIV